MQSVGLVARPAPAVRRARRTPSEIEAAAGGLLEADPADKAAELPVRGIRVAASARWRTMPMAGVARVQTRPASLDPSTAALPQTVALRNGWPSAARRSSPPLVPCGAHALTR